MNSSLSNSLLKTIFLILFLVLLAEIGYFFYSEKKTNQEDNIPIANISSTNKDNKEEQKIETAPDIYDFNEVTKLTLKNTAKAIALGFLERSEIVNTFKGKLIAIEKEGFDKYDLIEGYKPVLGFKLEVKPNVRPVSFLFNQEEYENALVEELSSSGSANPKTLEDLKVGQLVEVTETYKLLDDNKLFQYRISIIN